MIQTENLVTLWYREGKDETGNKIWEFNHLTLGYDSGSKPTPKVLEHNKLWKGGNWGKRLAMLHNNVVINQGEMIYG